MQLFMSDPKIRGIQVKVQGEAKKNAVSEIKFLADVNVEKPLVDYLSKQGYYIKWIPDYDCEMFDEELLQMANEEQRILITNDKGFGDLVIIEARIIQ